MDVGDTFLAEVIAKGDNERAIVLGGEISQSTTNVHLCVRRVGGARLTAPVAQHKKAKSDLVAIFVVNYAKRIQ